MKPERGSTCFVQGGFKKGARTPSSACSKRRRRKLADEGVRAPDLAFLESALLLRLRKQNQLDLRWGVFHVAGKPCYPSRSDGRSRPASVKLANDPSRTCAQEVAVAGRWYAHLRTFAELRPSTAGPARVPGPKKVLP